MKRERDEIPLDYFLSLEWENWGDGATAEVNIIRCPLGYGQFYLDLETESMMFQKLDDETLTYEGEDISIDISSHDYSILKSFVWRNAVKK